MRSRAFYSLAIVSALALGGCATVTRGTTSQVQVTSEPSGAQATTTMGHSCTTPCTLSLSRRDEFSVVFRLDGHEEQTIEVKAQLGGAGAAGLAGNVLIGGVVGIVADAASGATLEHVPNPVHAVMKRLAPIPAPRRTPSRAPRATQQRLSVSGGSIHGG